MALEEIKRRGYVSQDLVAVEDAAIASVMADPENHINAYKQDERSFNGRYVCADLFKETFASYSVSRESRGRYNGAVHNSAAVLSAEQFRRTLADNGHPERDKALFLTGSPGAGKTSSILASGELDPDSRVVFEGQLSNPKTSIEKVQQALDAGLKVNVVVVHPLPENALENTLKRYYQEGRGASIDVMASIQGGLPASLEAIHDKFGDAVALTIIDRRDFKNSVELTGWEHLPVLSSEGNYEHIKHRLKAALDKYREQGIIDDGAYRQANGDAPIQTNTIVNKANGGRFEQNASRRSFPRGSGQENFLGGASGDDLLGNVEEVEREQQSLLETTAPIDQTYQEILGIYVEAKHEQAERIEDRLENLINRQQSKLQQTQANQPGMFSLPGTKRGWQAEQMKQQTRLQSLHSRLEIVREIANDMGVYAPRIEELAARKLRAQEPTLAAEWDEMCVAQRHHEALVRKQGQQGKKLTQGGGLTIGLSPPCD